MADIETSPTADSTEPSTCKTANPTCIDIEYTLCDELTLLTVSKLYTVLDITLGPSG